MTNLTSILTYPDNILPFTGIVGALSFMEQTTNDPRYTVLLHICEFIT